MTLGAWIAIVIVEIIIISIGILVALEDWTYYKGSKANPGERERFSQGHKKLFGVIGIAMLSFLIMFGGFRLYYNNTESGKRSLKSWESNIDGGIERTVTVYNIDGDIIQQYSGKFDVDTNDNRIIFDDENGKRHMIYWTTGTVIIDEN